MNILAGKNYKYFKAGPTIIGTWLNPDGLFYFGYVRSIWIH